MKITSFNPQIITRDAEPAVKLFEELGFEKRHQKEGIGEYKVKGIVMKHPDGFHVDISESKAPIMQDLAVIRINVDDFDETYALLKSKGFENFYGDRTADTPTSKSAIMRAPSGFVINLIQHIKNHD